MKTLTETQKTLLCLLSSALFGRELHFDAASADWRELKDESMNQTVFTLVYPVVRDMLPEDTAPDWALSYKRLRAKNMKIDFEHIELHELMEQNAIPYTVLKGFSSAYYYPSPFDRMMGDVDFLVASDDVDKAGKALETVGFECDPDDRTQHHVEYSRGNTVWELHYSMGGIPQGECGDKIREILAGSIERSAVSDHQGITCRLPGAFDHGVVMLVHIANHLTESSGVGLRHLCDWAVFVNGADISAYRERLEEIGLWTFACQLTAVCAKYLGSKEYDWCAGIPSDFLESFICDIAAAGNFGRKEDNRGAGNRMAKSSNIFGALALRAKEYYPFCRNSRLLLPIGMARFAGLFIWRRVSGKKKWVTPSDISESADRRKLYEQFRLYEPR